jgi:hypothetical protein
MSLSVALTQLGFPCYHMIDVFKNNDTDKWLQAYHTTCAGSSVDVAGNFFSRPGGREYTAAVDLPMILWYKQLLKDNPGAKVILTVRDTPEVRRGTGWVHTLVWCAWGAGTVIMACVL